MNRSRPWTLDGIPADSQRLAEKAAQRSGLSVASWIESVILEKVPRQAAENNETDDEDDRLKEITARLDRLRHQKPDRDAEDAAISLRSEMIASIDAVERRLTLWQKRST